MRSMYSFQFQLGPGSVWQSIPPPELEQPGTSSWPIMCLRSMGISYFLQHHAESCAEAWYILLVNHSGLSMKPACSMPMLCVFVSHQPACQAMSPSRTHCASLPLLLTTQCAEACAARFSNQLMVPE